jgi:hypothetical protein
MARLFKLDKKENCHQYARTAFSQLNQMLPIGLHFGCSSTYYNTQFVLQRTAIEPALPKAGPVTMLSSYFCESE